MPERSAPAFLEELSQSPYLMILFGDNPQQAKASAADAEGRGLNVVNIRETSVGRGTAKQWARLFEKMYMKGAHVFLWDRKISDPLSVEVMALLNGRGFELLTAYREDLQSGERKDHAR